MAGQVTWTSLNNGYQVTQFYHGAVYPDGQSFFGGTQDNGTLRGTVAGGQNWGMIRGGDGGYVAVNQDNTNILYGEYTGKSLQRSTDGGANWAAIHRRRRRGLPVTTSSSIRSRWIRATRHRLWYGGAFAWRSDNGGTTGRSRSNAFGARIASWAIAPSDAEPGLCRRAAPRHDDVRA